jgi:ribonucleotide monophosphatase NagD (HAD superfamily)
MIGDNIEADVLGAEAVGIPAILVRNPHLKATHFRSVLLGIPALLSMGS